MLGSEGSLGIVTSAIIKICHKSKFLTKLNEKSSKD